jgi:DNA-binding PadR family transcriptional regulator
MKLQQQLETLPSLCETIVLFIIRTNEFVSGYQIRKLFMETTKKGISFGTLVPMLHRFERAEFVIKERDEENPPSYLWHLTPLGLEELDSRLALLSRVLHDREPNVHSVPGAPKPVLVQAEIRSPIFPSTNFQW